MKQVLFRARQRDAFTRLEIITLCAVGMLMVGLALPALARGKSRSDASVCLDHQRRLILAWQLYAQDAQDRVVNNYGVTETFQEINRRSFGTWANNIMTWVPGGVEWVSQTNQAWLGLGPFGRYTGGDPELFKCPADRFASTAMVRAGVQQRLRSVAMNTFFGRYSASPTDPTAQGRNWVFPNRRQFLKISDCPKPQKTWVFLDEHPDSINDGLFLNTPTANSWLDIVASQHEGAAGLAFTDGHVELKHWLSSTSKYPVRFQQLSPRPFDAAGKTDFQWWRERTGFVRLDGTPEYGY